MCGCTELEVSDWSKYFLWVIRLFTRNVAVEQWKGGLSSQLRNHLVSLVINDSIFLDKSGPPLDFDIKIHDRSHMFCTWFNILIPFSNFIRDYPQFSYNHSPTEFLNPFPKINKVISLIRDHLYVWFKKKQKQSLNSKLDILQKKLIFKN